MAEENSYPVELVDRDQAIRIRFRNKDEFVAFLSEEIEQWSQLISLSDISPALRGIVQDISVRVFSSASNSVVNDDLKGAIRYLGERKPIYKDGRLGKLIIREIENNPNILASLLISIQSSINTSNRAYLKNSENIGQRDIYNLLSGVPVLVDAKKSAKADRDRAAALFDDLNEAINKGEDAIEEFSSWSKEEKDKFSNELDMLREAYKKTIDDCQKKLANALAESNSKIKELEERTLQRLVLEAPTTYWNKKARTHNFIAGFFGLVFLVAIGGAVWWLECYGIATITEARQAVVGEGSDTTGVGILVPLAFITLPGLALAWLLRHVSRVIVQNLSLAADARLRGTIAHTYMALTEGRDASEGELAIALQALFRPIDGSDHSEVAPPNLTEVFNLGKQ